MGYDQVLSACALYYIQLFSFIIMYIRFEHLHSLILCATFDL